MRNCLTLLVASTALSVAVGLPVRGATQDASAADLAAPGRTPALAMPGTAAAPGLFLLAGDDDDEGDDDDDEGDDDDDDDDGCDDDDDDDDDCGRRLPNPAPAGSVAPPANGLFGNGAPPQVKVN